MSRSSLTRFLLCASVLIVASVPQMASACAACYGKSDSNLAKGFNWGVLSLLFVVLCVLGGIGAFFVHVAKRSAAISQNAIAPLADANR
jgi:hypothetical protein